MNTLKYNLLHETFDNEFTIERYSRFIREFFNEPEMFREQKHTGIWKEYSDHIRSYHIIAKYTDDDDNNLIVLAVELLRDSSINHARSRQRNFISKILDDNGMEAAIVAFYTKNEPSWRLSFVRLDYSFSDKGIKFDLTPARRYSYLIGANEPNHTAEAQLLPIFEDDKHNPVLDDIESAFSVEKVTKEFFSEYKDKYLDIKEYLEQDSSFIEESQKLGFEADKFSEQFAKKLMGQLSFLYFLQKKGWLGVRIMPENHILSKDEFRRIFTNQDGAHKSILTRVFRETSAGDMKLSAKELFTIDEHEAGLLSDCFINTQFDMPWGSGNRTFIRTIFNSCINNTNKNFFAEYLQPFFYEALNYKRKNQYFKRFNCKIPFLNGGLFEPLEGYHWKDVSFEIPNELFSNEKKLGRDANGILDIFDRFNFTMNEDEPLEKEVAVDPEMLGKIFENLLDVNDRKSKGAFYTPREIVHYMCKESLINYLVQRLSLPYEDLREFIYYGEIIKDADSRSGVGFKRKYTIKESILNNISDIDKALENVKIADPSVGSGAFPLGMLNEITRARNNITEYIIKKDLEGVFGRVYGEEYIRKHRSLYDIKWKTIKNCIFAVDIEPSAVDITKLRLWLSVIVDQEIDDSNSVPHALPNLDMNIHTGNSLVDEYEGIKLFDKSILFRYLDESSERQINPLTQMSFLVDQTDEWLDTMFKVQDKYFEENDTKKKQEYKAEIEEIRDGLIRYKLNREGEQTALREYENSLKLKSRPYFIWELEYARVFKENGGFDIVIGNPPYIGERKNKEVFRKVQQSSLNKYYLGRMDYFYFFFHLALDLLKDGGICSLITTNYYITALGGRKLRLDLKDRSTILDLVNFNEAKVFNSAAGQHNMITSLKKGKYSNVAKSTTCLLDYSLSNKEIAVILNRNNRYVESYSLPQNELWDGEECYLRLMGINKKNPMNIIMDKIVTNSTDLLGNICKPLIGLESSLDKVYVISKEKSLEITNNNELEMQYIKPLYKNSDISRYFINESSNKFILYLHEKIDNIESLEGIYSYLKENEEAIKGRKGANLRGAFKRGNWWVLNTPRLDMDFEDTKIVTPYRTKTLRFAISDNSWYASRDVYYITKNKDTVSLKYILAILNSKLFYAWFYYRGKRKGEMLELYAKPLKEVPIIEITHDKQKPFISLVDSIIENQKKHIDTTKEENQIDLMVYSLYGLTEEEIKLIESKYPKEA